MECQGRPARRGPPGALPLDALGAGRHVVESQRHRHAGIKAHQADRVGNALVAERLDRCELGPNMVIYPEGVWYRYESTEDLDEIVQTHLIEGGRVERLMLQPDQK